MRRIAVFADVHGNIPALEAILDDLEFIAPDEVIVAGDLVGRGPQGSAVAEVVRAKGWATVRGNHEDYTIAFKNGAIPDDWKTKEEWAASRWMGAELSDEAAGWLGTLPFNVESQIDSEMKVYHGSPRSHSEGLGPWSSDAELSEFLGECTGSILVCAHTHRPMIRRVHAGMVVNVGSVGLPFNRDPRAQYALFESRDGRWDATIRALPYDRSRTMDAYESTGFLREGGITAELLHMELEHARPFLVPFQAWARVQRLEPVRTHLERFLEVFESIATMREFYGLIASLRVGGDS